MRSTPVLLVSVLAVCLAACGNFNEIGQMNEEEAKKIALAYVRERMPGRADLLTYRLFVLDKSDLWVVLFQPQDHFQTGGTPDIFVDKKTGVVTKVGYSQ